VGIKEDVMGLIEWREFESAGSGDNFKGYVGSKKIFEIYDNGDDYQLSFLGKTSGYFSALEEAKAKADELFTEWLKSAGLVQRPESCGKCGDKGWVRKFPNCGGCDIETRCPKYDLGCDETDSCPCTKDPNSLYSFIKEIRGG
jgi:hypothetical protein